MNKESVDIENLANLARIKISSSDKAKLEGEFSAILAYVEQIKKAPISHDDKPVPGAVRNVVRDDRGLVCDEDTIGLIMKNVPNKESNSDGEYVTVKKIIS